MILQATQQDCVIDWFIYLISIILQITIQHPHIHICLCSHLHTFHSNNLLLLPLTAFPIVALLFVHLRESFNWIFLRLLFLIFLCIRFKNCTWSNDWNENKRDIKGGKVGEIVEGNWGVWSLKRCFIVFIQTNWWIFFPKKPARISSLPALIENPSSVH